MSSQLPVIEFGQLAVSAVPALVVIGISYKWQMNYKSSLYAFGRMLLQLSLIGYLLVFIFNLAQMPLVLAILAFMMISASVIAMRSVGPANRQTWLRIFAALVIGAGGTFVLIFAFVLKIDPWYQPRYVIPIAGMIFSNSMTAISLAGERFQAEWQRSDNAEACQKTALNAALIPITNSLLAVGLVSLPGMMTGQILSGVSPLLAARYQIMVMCMLYGSAGISAALYLKWVAHPEQLSRQTQT